MFFNAWLKMTSTKAVKRIHMLPVILWEPADRHSGEQIKPPCKIISVIFISMMIKCLWHKAETKQILTRQAIYVQLTQELVCKHCCSSKAMSITTWVCICSLRCPVCNAHTPHCQLWPAPLCNIFPHYLINGTISEKKKKSCWTHNAFCDFLYKDFLKHFSF